MTLAELLVELPVRDTHGDLNTDVGMVRSDSRKIVPGDVFVAVKNAYYDGHQFIDAAIDAGASAVVYANPVSSERLESVPWVRLHNTIEALGPMCARRNDQPSRKMELVGVTGTNGKTTTCHMLEAILQSAGRTVGLIGTTGVRYAGKDEYTGLTTPEAPELHELLARMVEDGVQTVAMEVSSHGIKLRRVTGCDYAVGVLTGVGSDHLDFHASHDDYRETKVNWLLDDVVHSKKVYGAVVPYDDDAGREVLSEFRGNILTFGFDDAADIVPAAAKYSPSGTRGVIMTPNGALTLHLRAPGRHNVRNAMAAIGAAILLNIEPIAIVEGLQRFAGAPGRFEAVPNDREVTVLVDYAHTPDALAAAISSARELTAGKVIVVFGCGGDRDKQKRPEMGGVVSEGADIMVVTSDNPRSEDPQSIVDEIIKGVPETRAADTLHADPDRRAAIQLAIGMATAGDTVLIAGKGHETQQIIGETVVEFDDRVVAAEALR